MNLYDGLIWNAIGVDSGGGGGGGGGDSGTAVSGKDVNLYDYDGTLLHSYSKSEFLALSSLPSNPNRNDRLVAKGWNWSLADAKDYVRDYGILDIGQMYDTASGKTEIDTSFYPYAKHPYLKFYVNGTATIEWGDGTSDNITGSSLYASPQSIDHEYAAAGDYTIKIDGEVKPYATSNQIVWISDGVTKGYGSQSANVLYYGNVKRIYISKDFHVVSDMLNGFISLEEITISPDSLETVLSRLFSSETKSLVKCVVLPTNITSIGANILTGSEIAVCCFHPNITLASTTSESFPKYAPRLCLPPLLTAVYSSNFSSNYAREIVFPNDIASGIIPDSMPYLKEVIYPSAMETCSIYNYGSYALNKIVIPSGCLTVSSKVYKAYVLKEIHVKATTPPTLNEADAFTNLAADAKIYVPTASLAAYQAATNWSTFADKMIGE